MAEPHQVLNDLPAGEAEQTLLRCCGSRRWAAALLGLRPFASTAALHAAAEHTWAELDREDWLEAFAQHPAIGAPVAAGWSAEEQAGLRGAEADTRQALAAANAAYALRFGFIFIVCATGKSAEEMLALLRARAGNDPDSELRIAAGEQAKITRLRLSRLAA